MLLRNKEKCYRTEQGGDAFVGTLALQSALNAFAAVNQKPRQLLPLAAHSKLESWIAEGLVRLALPEPSYD